MVDIPKIPNPFKSVDDFRRNRRISSVRDKYSYNLDKWIRERKHKSKDDLLMIGGIIAYAIALLFFADSIFSSAIVFVVMCAPFGLSFITFYLLQKTTTVTMYIVPRDPERKNREKVVLVDIDFGRPLNTSKEVKDWLKNNNRNLCDIISTDLIGDFPKKKDSMVPDWVFRKNTQPEFEGKIIEDLNASLRSSETDLDVFLSQAFTDELRFYVCTTRGSDIPFIIPLPDDWQSCLQPKPEQVSLEWGEGELRHAEIRALECDPIKTTLYIEDTMLDVDIPIFLPYFTEQVLDIWLETGKWFVPNQTQKVIAQFTKTKNDNRFNEPKFTELEDKCNNLSISNENLLLERQFGEINADVEGGLMKHLNLGTRPTGDYVFTLVLAGMTFAMGWFACVLLS